MGEASGQAGGQAKVVIYTTTYCGYCNAAKMFFRSKGVAYEEIDLTGDDEGRDALRERTKRNTVPQIFVGDRHIGGYDDMRALDRAGGFMPLVQGGASA